MFCEIGIGARKPDREIASFTRFIVIETRTPGWTLAADGKPESEAGRPQKMRADLSREFLVATTPGSGSRHLTSQETLRTDLRESWRSVQGCSVAFRHPLAEGGNEFGVQPCKGSSQTLLLVELADGCLNPSRISKSAKEVIGGEAGKPLPIHALALPKHPLARKQSQNGIAYPCALALQPDFFVLATHGQILTSRNRARQLVHAVLLHLFAKMLLRIGIPVTRLQLHEDA